MSIADRFPLEPPLKTSTATNTPYNPTDPTDWPSPLPNTILGALDYLAKRTSVVVLAQLNTGGVWFPNNWIGPGGGSSSTSSPMGYNVGTGFLQVTKRGKLSHFSWTNADFPIHSDIPADIYLAPNGNPALFGYTGVSLTMPTYSYATSNLIDEIDVFPGDIIAVYNPSLFVGYSPSALQITAHYLPVQ